MAIEIDGWAWHVDQDRFVNDRRKGNALVRAGWVVLRFTWHDLTGAPHSVVTASVASIHQSVISAASALLPRIGSTGAPPEPDLPTWSSDV